MKYTININQKAVAAAGFHTKTDVIDWAILDYIDSWQKSPKATRVDGYVWLNYKHLIQEMPLLGLRAKQSVSDRIRKLRGLNLIDSIQLESDGGRLYVRTTELFFDITQFSTESVSLHDVRSDGQGVRSDGQGVRSDGHSTYNQNKLSEQHIKTNNNNNSETIDLNNHNQSSPVPVQALLLSEDKKQKAKERQKEVVKVVLSPLAGLTDSQIKTATKELVKMSPEQRDLAIQSFNKAAEQNRFRNQNPMVLLNSLITMGLNGELEPPVSCFSPNPTHAPTNDIKTPVEPVLSEEEAKAKDREGRIKIAKKYIAKETNKEAMLNDFKRVGAVYIGGHGAFFEPELRAAGLFD